MFRTTLALALRANAMQKGIANARFFSASLLRRSQPAAAPRSRASRFWRNTKLLFGLTTGVLTGYIGYEVYLFRYPPAQLAADKTKKKLVILGTGWGSVSLLKSVDTSNYDVTVISPRNYFLFTPLLPSCTTGMIEHRSIMEPIRAIIRGRPAEVTFVEAEVTDIEPTDRTVTVSLKAGFGGEDSKGIPDATEKIKYDILVIGVGSEVSTYGIPGVKEHGLFLKEIEHAQQIRKRIMDCIEAASFPGIDEETRKRLLSTVVVGGGPTGVEFAGELHDFFVEDLRKWDPSVSGDLEVTLIEALPNVLPSFSKHLVDYTEKTLKDEHIRVLTKTAVKEVTEHTIIAEQTLPNGQKERIEIPYGLFVWAGGNMVRPVIRELFKKIPEQHTARRGLLIDEYLKVKGTDDIYAIGDCTSSHYAPTAQVASQEGVYLGGLLNRIARRELIEQSIANIEHKLPTASSRESEVLAADLKLAERQRRRFSDLTKFQYSHQGSLAYIGSERAVADLSFWGNALASSGQWTYLFWRSAYLSMCFSLRNKALVCLDWTKVKLFGRDVSRE